VELLVVIGIIAVLVSILIPVLSKARRQAIGVKCASNLRQFATAWGMYANNYKGVSCPMRLPELAGPLQDLGQGPHYRPRWADLLGAQMKSYAYAVPPSDKADENKPIENEQFLCPEVSEWVGPRNYAYGYNFQFLGNPRKHPAGRFVRFPVQVGGIAGADTVMAADSMGTAAGKAKTSRAPYQVGGFGNLSALGNHGYTIDPPRLTDRSDYSEDNSRTPVDRSAPDPRHNGKANVAFCDGHVSLMAMEELGYVVRADGGVEAGGAGAHNKLFSGTTRDDDPPPVD
jgi:prepilin-type processing-associated H-X9-DG protein